MWLNQFVNVWAADSIKDGLTNFTLWRFNITILHLLLMCVFSCSDWSNHTLRYLITSLFAILLPLMCMEFVVQSWSIWRDPNMINSVFPSFMHSRFSSIHDFTLMAVFSSNFMLVCSTTHDFAWKEFSVHGHLQIHGHQF